jgi:hypothetical protein
MSEFANFQNNQLLTGEEYDMHATRPDSSNVSRVAAAAAAAATAADDEFKVYLTEKARVTAPESTEMQEKLIKFAMLYDKLRKNEITPFEFEKQIMDIDLTEDQKQLASMLCLERLHGGKRKSHYSKTNKMRRSKSNKRSRSRSNKRYRSRK